MAEKIIYKSLVCCLIFTCIICTDIVFAGRIHRKPHKKNPRPLTVPLNPKPNLQSLRTQVFIEAVLAAEKEALLEELFQMLGNTLQLPPPLYPYQDPTKLYSPYDNAGNAYLRDPSGQPVCIGKSMRIHRHHKK